MFAPANSAKHASFSILKSNKSALLNLNLRFYTILKMTSQSKWKIEKNKILNMSLEEKRKIYRNSDFIALNRIEPWSKYAPDHTEIASLKPTEKDTTEFKKTTINTAMDKELAEKVSMFQGDITKLEIDAIVNAANARLVAGGGVDGAIHRAAGPLLQQECNSHNGCLPGNAVVTGGYNLPAKYVIHTVGPQDGSAETLRSCYEKCLSFHHEYKIKSIAFPCIATGIYGFPNQLAAHIALRAARKVLETNPGMERIIFCTFMPLDVDIYKTLMQIYFPIHNWNGNDDASSSD